MSPLLFRLTLTTYITTESIGYTDTETGKGKLIVGNYLQPVGHGFQFGMADKQIVDIQAEV